MSVGALEHISYLHIDRVRTPGAPRGVTLWRFVLVCQVLVVPWLATLPLNAEAVKSLLF